MKKTIALLAATLCTLYTYGTAQAGVIGIMTPSALPQTLTGYGPNGLTSVGVANVGNRGLVSILYGNCGPNSGIRTCTSNGSYVDGMGGMATGGGTFSFTMRYNTTELAGGVVPLIGRVGSNVVSTDPNNPYNFYNFAGFGDGTLLTLTVNPLAGAPITLYLGSQTVGSPFLDQFQFSTAFADPSCSGLASNQACSVGSVANTRGATISGPSTFQFSFDRPIQPNVPSNVPIASTLSILSLGLTGIGFMQRRRRLASKAIPV